MLRRALGQLAITSGLVVGTVVLAAGTAAADVSVTYSVDENRSPTAVVSADPYDPGADAIVANNGQYWLTEPSEPLALLVLRCFDGAWALGPDLPAIEDVSYVTIDPVTFDAIFSPAVILDETLCNPLIESPSSATSSVSSPSMTSQPTVTIDPFPEVGSAPASSPRAVTDSAESTVASTWESGSASGAASTSTQAAAAPPATTATTTSTDHTGPALAATGTAPEGALYTALALLAGGAGLAYLGTKQRRRQSSHS